MIPSDFPVDIFKKYAGLALPRHVSYPMPTAWTDLDGDDFLKCLNQPERNHHDLSLYIHIPFCETLCKFCACNRVILKKEAKGAEDKRSDYLDCLKKEIQILASQPGSRKPVRQIQWGGGSPTYLSPDEIASIHHLLVSSFDIAPDAEIAMEIDPRRTNTVLLKQLRALGFNRLSMGIQDFNPVVQEHVNRIQPLEMVESTTRECRQFGFPQLNFDLIYGMPYQTVASVQNMVQETIRLRPSRIAFYHYAQIPDKIATQRGMDYTRLPDSLEKLEMFLDAIHQFTTAGYNFIGLDHFALPDDPLNLALLDGTLNRNFQGMTTHAGLDQLGIGAYAISHLQGIGYWQKEKEIDAYQAGLYQDTLPVIRGIHFSQDDLIRQEIISHLYCYGIFDPSQIESKYDIDGETYFANEFLDLKELAEDGVVSIDNQRKVYVTHPLGRVLIRNIASVFDAYLDPHAFKHGDRYYYSVSA